MCIWVVSHECIWVMCFRVKKLSKSGIEDVSLKNPYAININKTFLVSIHILTELYATFHHHKFGDTVLCHSLHECRHDTRQLVLSTRHYMSVDMIHDKFMVMKGRYMSHSLHRDSCNEWHSFVSTVSLVTKLLHECRHDTRQIYGDERSHKAKISLNCLKWSSLLYTDSYTHIHLTYVTWLLYTFTSKFMMMKGNSFWMNCLKWSSAIFIHNIAVFSVWTKLLERGLGAWWSSKAQDSPLDSCYGAATIGRLLKIPGLFCRISSLL